MNRSPHKRPVSRTAFGEALHRLETEAMQSGRSLREQLLVSADKFWRDRQAGSVAKGSPFADLPVEFLQELVHYAAGRSKRTPGRQIEKAIRPWASDESPKQLRDWYAQIYGEFSEGVLSEVMSETLLFATRRDGRLTERIRRAVLSGEVKAFEQIARCVALIHGIRHESTGVAARVAGHNKKLIGFSYLYLFELEQKPPTAADIRIDLARDLCAKDRNGKPPKFSDIWYLLRSTADDGDERSKAATRSRYEVITTRHIKKVLNSLKWPFRPSRHGRITVDAVKSVLDRAGRKYFDDSETVLEDA